LLKGEFCSIIPCSLEEMLMSVDKEPNKIKENFEETQGESIEAAVSPEVQREASSIKKTEAVVGGDNQKDAEQAFTKSEEDIAQQQKDDTDDSFKVSVGYPLPSEESFPIGGGVSLGEANDWLKKELEKKLQGKQAA